MRSLLLFPLGLFVAMQVGCGSAPATDPGASEDDLRTTYGTFSDTLQEADLDRWFEVRRALIDGFERICGDTICSGDYSNLRTLDLTCSSTSIQRKLKDCTWTLAGSIDHIAGDTGFITTQPRVFSCHIPVGGNAKTMLDALALAGEEALDTKLASGVSFYDGLVSCFEGVVGPPLPSSEGAEYKDLAELMWEVGDDEGVRWNGIQRTLAERFDDVCGDTFCEGDYSDIALVEVTCPTQISSKKVRSCRFTFGKVNTRVGSRGVLINDTATQSCDVPINATATALANALDGEDPLNANLPGRSSSIYDALADCL